jgi:organic hydroperoxide reductase OsmC/OhrA
MREHRYAVSVRWTGNLGEGTATYRGYRRDHEISAAGKPTLAGSSDPVFRGDPSRWNPEELLVGALSACHMLSFLHLCADTGIVATAYTDQASGEMRMNPDGSGQFTGVVLRPRVAVTDPARAGELEGLHHKAHGLCFIARSVNFPVECRPEAVEFSPAACENAPR